MRSVALSLLLLAAPFAFASDGTEITNASVLAGMNEYRAAHGLAPLREDPRLTKAAEDRMRHMEELGYWKHESPDGMSPFVWLSARDYPFSFAGENLATGFETVGVLVDSWMESPGHRDNIMDARYEHVGIAIIDGATTRPAIGRSVVVLFGAVQRQVTVASTRRE